MKKTRQKKKDEAKLKKSKKDAELDQRLKGSFPASDSTAQY